MIFLFDFDYYDGNFFGSYELYVIRILCEIKGILRIFLRYKLEFIYKVIIEVLRKNLR